MKALRIRTKLTSWYSLILAVSLSTFGAVAYFAMSGSIRATVDEDLRARLVGVRDIIAEDAPKGPAALQDEIKEFADGLGVDGRVRVADQNGQVIFTSRGLDPKKMRPARYARLSRSFYQRIGPDAFRVLHEKIELAGVQYDVTLAISMNDYDRALLGFRLGLFFAVPAFLGLAAFGGYWMSRRALAPVDEITRSARRIEAHDLSQRLTVPRSGDELSRLVGTLNEMLGRLETAFQRITQFTADASHELRTPVSVIRTSAELALSKPRAEDEYRETLSLILSETEKVSELIQQLLDLARADSGFTEFSLVRTDLYQPLRDACRQASLLAQSKQITFRQNIPNDSIWIAGESSALEKLFLIVLDNAVKYTPSGGEIDVCLKSNEQFASVDIRDTGIGIALADIPHVFDRFYRVDRVRSRESGGTGLGLAIGRWIAQAHRGDIRVHSELSKGSTFEIRLPLWSSESATPLDVDKSYAL
ncbi:MAG TPA: ATP-binding protein [Candidatus Acidoferrales bacterium]|jgi:heavy metal sensor kinase|nr:ATP-binding protein [Candidatus Acidoferrales bacterium]